ncbi:bacteriohemerythrin [Magnetospirillum sp. UT-4]|uniref:bacteriohemerythrin n=1 Tax=Magnetospirillum sp. UT-4 TaxID=2681467 RepID=UPI001381BF91|nr:hemerythrin family protein [Magnetospirillum sp. UT-4]CAA7613867.1 hypothetical protein MTBUT4_160004 [Magnetospirillum sp. UT-4]
MPLEWRDQLSIGVPSIDADHKQLIAIINEFEAGSSAGAERLQSVARKLFQYAASHFEREERLQVLNGYGRHQAHQAEHNALLDSLEAFIQSHFIDRTKPIDTASAAEMAAFLKHWLVDHLIHSDLKMKGLVTER